MKTVWGRALPEPDVGLSIHLGPIYYHLAVDGRPLCGLPEGTSTRSLLAPCLWVKRPHRFLGSVFCATCDARRDELGLDLNRPGGPLKSATGSTDTV